MPQRKPAKRKPPKLTDIEIATRILDSFRDGIEELRCGIADGHVRDSIMRAKKSGEGQRSEAFKASALRLRDEIAWFLHDLGYAPDAQRMIVMNTPVAFIHEVTEGRFNGKSSDFFGMHQLLNETDWDGAERH